MALPTIAGILQVQPPIFVRKLRRRNDWGQPADSLDQRVREAVEKLFRTQADPAISIYLIRNDEDLRRVALGMNAGRDSLKEAVAFVAFLPAELEQAGIPCTQTVGDLVCEYANRLHYDMVATDRQLARLCEIAMGSGRVAGNCSGGIMNSAIAEAQKENCRSVASEGNCQVHECSPSR